MKLKWLYLPVEIKVRELDSKLLLAYYALREGYQVVIGSHRKVEQASQSLPQGIFLAKGYPKRIRKRVLTRAKGSGHAVLELDEEGLILSKVSRYTDRRMDPAQNRYLDAIYCWGNYQKNTIQKAYPETRKKCIITGNPRFDLLTPKYRALYQDGANTWVKKYGEYILINTRFTLYNSLRGLKTEKLSSEGEYIKLLFGHFITMIKELAHAYPEKTLVIRPHPGEDPGSYKRKCGGLNNVRIDSKGNVIHWILGAEAVIHNGCTTGIEGYLLDKPVIAYQPISNSIYKDNLPNRVSVIASDMKQLKELLNNGEVHQGPGSADSFSKYYGPLDGKYAYEYILNQMRKLSVPASVLPDLNKIRFTKEKRKKGHTVFPSLNTREIKAFFAKLDELEKRPLHVNIRNLTDRLFMLSPKGGKK